MNALSEFEIARKWPAQHPDRIQLYSLPTPNGVKASLMLEESGLPYEPHLVRFEQGDQKTPEFRSLNPYGKIPAIIDPKGADGRPVPLFESAAILMYLADKSGKLLAHAGPQRYETLQWLMFTSAGVSPIFGQLGFFHKFEGREYEDKRPRDRYVNETRRLLEVLNDRLAQRTWLMGDEYTIADVATFPVVRNLVGFYDAGDLVRINEFPHVVRTLETWLQRPAVQRAINIPART